MMIGCFREEKIMFITRALEKILSERDIRKNNNQQLKKSCEYVLEKIKNEQITKNNNQSSSTLPTTIQNEQSSIFDDELYFQPFDLACKSKSNRIIIIALDCIQKLIAYGHFTGNCFINDQNNQDNQNEKKLIDIMVNSICNCFIGPTTDDEIQLQIIKALLTIVTSQKCEVHEASILLVIRTCYNIYLSSKKLVNQTTAKAALTQMLNVIFTRMESASVDNLDGQSMNDEQNECSELFEIYQQQSDNDQNDKIESIVDDLITTVCKQQHSDNLSIQSTQSMHSIHSIHSIQKHQQRKQSSKISLNNGSVIQTSTMDSFETNDTIHLLFDNIYQKDAYLIFRSLCKLSMKPLMMTNETSVINNSNSNITSTINFDIKSHELRSKILSLQLILQILQNSGPVFQQSDMFSVAIKQYLCVSLSKNSVSNIPEIFELSLAIFLSLFEKFKQYLKIQIEVFFKEIFLNILETSSSSFEHKWIVIQALTRICADAQSIVDIYVNYDCDLSSENIFGRLVNDLSKIANRQIQESGSIVNSSSTQQQQQQERSMRMKGLECLVSILKCMVEWSNDLYVNPQQQSDLISEKQPNDLNHNNNHNNPDDDNPEKYEEVKNQKNIIDKGIDLFNLNAMKGIQYLQHHNIINTTATDVAKFFHQTNDRLDKSIIGEFMGDNKQFNKEVMYAYVDQMDFSNRDIVNALRFFLEGFRLPGEAQKIDRFMEKFASRYFENNSHNLNIFSSADTVYVLAYSIIMLTTDLHSPQVKNKITKEDYIKLNRGINDSKDLPEKYLSQIYDEIAESEIKMKGNNNLNAIKKLTGNKKELNNEKTRRLLYNMEMETMASTAKALMESVSHVESHPFTSAKHLEHVRPMFRTTWTSFLAAFSVGLQDCQDHDQGIATHCLNGIRCAIRIACIFQMSLERNAFVQALSRFTLLNANVPIVEMKTKNIDTIKTLITVAYTDGNYLGESWLDILRCISQLELAQLIGNNKLNHNGHINHMSNGLNNHNNTFGFQFKLESFVALESLSRIKEKETKILSESMIEASSQSIVVAVDRIFTGSIHLDGNAIVHFVRALCQVSSEELMNQSCTARMFSLQKIVEISYYNMNRIRLQWSRIWEILGEHFNKVGCNPNEEIAFFAIDSLRQLSMKFIEKGELSNFRFQKDFLRPFEYIMKCNSSISIRDLVVRCIAQMVNSQACNIKSGWKNIFSVFRIAASESDSYIFDLSFQTVCNIFNNIYEKNFLAMIDSFQDAIKCLSEFGCNQQFPDTSMEAIRLIRACARYVAEQPQYFKEFNVNADVTNCDHKQILNNNEDDSVWIRGWLPILFELSCIVNNCKLDVRTRALTVMFEIIKSHGAVFRENWWTDLFQIIFRIFDNLKFPKRHQQQLEQQPQQHQQHQQSEKIEWMMTTCNHALYSIVDVFTQYFDVVGTFLLKDVYFQLLWCVQQQNEQLARTGINCFENLVLACGPKYNQITWTITVELIERINAVINPLNHLSNNLNLNETELLESIQTKFFIQLDLIQSIDNILFYPSITKKEDLEMINLINNSIAVVSGDLNNIDSIDCSFDSNDEKIHNNNNNGLLKFINKLLLIQLSKFLYKIFKQSNECYLLKSRLLNDKLYLLSELEIKSLQCSLRILFYLYYNNDFNNDDDDGDKKNDENGKNNQNKNHNKNDDDEKVLFQQIEQELISTSSYALNYYYRIENEYNRDNWTIIIILILYNISRMPKAKFLIHIRHYYESICNLLLLDNLKLTLKILLRKIFLRINMENCIQF